VSSPDLFVVCKSCSKEVSPYVTECSYCGARLRKRAPKIEREGGRPTPPPAPAAPGRFKRKATRPVRAPKPARAAREPRLLAGTETGRPWATIVLVALSFGTWLSLAFYVREDLGITALDGDPWRFLTAPLLNGGFAAQLTATAGLAIFGWLLERRHGPVAVVGLFLLCGPGALLLAASAGTEAVVFGTHPAALGLLAAWAVPVLLGRRAGREDDEADMLGALVFAVVLLAIPALTQGSAVAGVLGGVFGASAGLVLARVRPR
jgi:membrane associated rhomboid family serine protease